MTTPAQYAAAAAATLNVLAEKAGQIEDSMHVPGFMRPKIPQAILQDVAAAAAKAAVDAAFPPQSFVREIESRARADEGEGS